MQVDPPRRDGLIPDIRLGSGARLKPYGFFKTSVIYDSSSPYGNDFPLPLLALWRRNEGFAVMEASFSWDFPSRAFSEPVRTGEMRAGSSTCTTV
jgi:hypothetical protein